MARYQVARNLAGKHQETTEAVDPVIDVLSKAGARVSPCVIARKGIIRTCGRHIKMRQEKRCVALVVLTKLGKQQLYVYGLAPEKVETALKTLEEYTLKIES